MRKDCIVSRGFLLFSLVSSLTREFQISGWPGSLAKSTPQTMLPRSSPSPQPGQGWLAGCGAEPLLHIRSGEGVSYRSGH
jgi:hypothetical protein